MADRDFRPRGASCCADERRRSERLRRSPAPRRRTAAPRVLLALGPLVVLAGGLFLYLDRRPLCRRPTMPMSTPTS